MVPVAHVDHREPREIGSKGIVAGHPDPAMKLDRLKPDASTGFPDEGFSGRDTPRTLLGRDGWLECGKGVERYPFRHLAERIEVHQSVLQRLEGRELRAELSPNLQIVQGEIQASRHGAQGLRADERRRCIQRVR